MGLSFRGILAIFMCTQIAWTLDQSDTTTEASMLRYFGNRETETAWTLDQMETTTEARILHYYGNNETEMSRNISIEGDSFTIDGKPLRIVSGSLHYFRLPAASWRDRLSKLRAAGLNAVSTYVEWSYHEPEERQYEFSGDRDIVQFIRLAAEMGLFVLLRPGPYICAERDLGGLPYWLLGKYPDIRLRTTDPNFISETQIWMSKLFVDRLTPLLYGNGGPIILVQVENEYGSYGSEREYMERLRDLMKEHVGDAALLYTTDGNWDTVIRNGRVSGALTTVDFGTVSDASRAFAPLRRLVPTGPLMNSEFYPGWLTHWGEDMHRVDKDAVVTTLRDMLELGANVNFYMFFGGTNFEFTAGANSGVGYQPDITSYDYDAPLNEAGDPTPKYNAIRDVLEEYYPETKKLPRPVASEKIAYGTIALRPTMALLSANGRARLGTRYRDVAGSRLPTFEAMRQRAGLMLYETKIPAGNSTSLSRLLHVAQPHDRVYVYVNGKLKGILSRMHRLFSLPLDAEDNAILSLLVESQGRINFGNLLHDYKGILSDVLLDNVTLAGDWTLLGYPLQQVPYFNDTLPENRQGSLTDGPVLYEGSLVLPEGEEPKDTFLNPSGWGKGYVWINGNNLGRYWPNVGPQVTLYVPGAWLRPGDNRVQVLELQSAPASRTMAFVKDPILDLQRPL